MSDVPVFDSGKPKGFKCTECKKYHEFDAYVLAHWNDRLVHDCDNCRARHAIKSGEVKLVLKAVKGWVPF